ncbi:hypothetical protein GQ44DRAFT_635012 [Phaeosphaeriaceae sp. PMI808]|nr:hypothetical protein GQ44DRAFT_635012 [Phaeosphaeriaceae sp. PMI808]
MHTLRVALLLLQALTVVEGAKWTLHKSCYRNKADNADDTQLENAMIDAVNTAKKWASQGSEKLKFSKGIFGLPLKFALIPLLNMGKYSDNADDVIAKFDELAKIEGPIGKTADASGRYTASKAWKDAINTDEGYKNFIIVCRPDLEDRPQAWHPLGPLPYDRIRETQLRNAGADHKVLTNQEDDPNIGDWDKIPGNKIRAFVTVDNGERRKHIPETITFHPLLIKREKARGFAGWTPELFAEITDKSAVRNFAERGEAKGYKNVTPMDGLLEESLVKTMFHEFFHLSAFGGMKDDKDAYGWYNNVQNQNHQNPDYFAIIAAVIELYYRSPKNYKVDEKGVVASKLT